MKVCPSCGTEYGDEAAFCSRDRTPLRPAEPGVRYGLLGRMVGDRYQVDSRLGEGGMGEVYLATHVLMGRRCALKVMNTAVSQDPDAVSRFNREATNASRISHPNVCAVYDFGLTPEGLVYLAMEYVEGQTLTAVAEARGPMPVGSAVELISQSAAGLEAAHELGIVHRDLKPDNIMVVSRGGKETVKLVDFGIAKAMEPEPSQRVTKTGFVVGTPEYMSPEQLAGDPLDGRTDQYSLALVLYRLLTGRLPFVAGSAQETLVKRLTDPPQPLLTALPGGKFPAGLQAVMDRALARYPAERYPSVAAFVQALRAVAPSGAEDTRRIVAAAGTGGGDIPPTQRIPGGAARRRSRTGLAVAGVAAVALGTWSALRFSGGGTEVVPPVPPVHDSGNATTGARASAPAGPPAPTPAPPPAPLSTKGAVPITDTMPPNLSALDSPALLRFETQRALRMMRSPRVPDRRKAVAAAFLGTAALQAGRRDSALALYRTAYRLNPRPEYLALIRQFGDTVSP
ncbi:MAG TPA: serine/threonine-protein kinase [Gemmatimonadales bacterium]|nr:serine/threonine-protein kinase [Gemmatimonadales bacterium]